MRTRTADIFLDDNAILHIITLPSVRMDHEDALDNLLVARQFTKNRPSLKLIDIRAGVKLTKKAKLLLDNSMFQNRTIARAILTNNSIKKVLLNFFIQYNSGAIPTKFFSNYNKAIEWLKTYQV